MRIRAWMVVVAAMGLGANNAGCGGSVEVFGADGGATGEMGGDDGTWPLPTGAGGLGGAGGTGAAPPTSSGTTAPAGSGGATSSGSSTSTTGSSSSASSSSSTGSGGGPVCDGTGLCDSCVSCAWNGPCQAYAQACLANAECVAIIQCYQQCNQQDCTTPCWIPHPAGHADYLAASICVTCDQCYADCSGDQVGCPEN